MRKIAVMLAVGLSLLCTRSEAQFPAAPGTGPGLAETIEAIDSARVTTRILYVTAHPDDESAAVLTYLARGLHAEVALLSLTRGEGGQNALGPEQAPQLGLIRTQELLAATRGYGVKLYLGREKDFGFSKTTEETKKIWGEEARADLVIVIRTFRPTLVINGWGGVHQGHGHHQTAGLLTTEAVKLAAQSDYTLCADCPDMWSTPYGPVPVLDLERGSESPKGYPLPIEVISPLWGKSWRDIGLDAFVNHRTQGISAFVDSPFLRRPVAVKREDGKDFDPKLFSQPLSALEDEISKAGCGSSEAVGTKLKAVDDLLIRARDEALQLHWKESAAAIAKAATALDSVAPNGISGKCGDLPLWADLESTRDRLYHALELAAGVQLEANASASELAVGNTFDIRVRVRCKPNTDCNAESPIVDLPNGMKEIRKSKDASGADVITVSVDSAPKPERWPDLEADPRALVALQAKVHVSGVLFSEREPVSHIAASSTSVSRVPLRMVPAYTLAVEPKQEIEKLAAKHEPFNVFLRVHSYSTKNANVTVGLDVPAGWKTSGTEELSFMGEGDRYAKLTLVPPQSLAAGKYAITAYAKRGEEKFTTSIEPLPSMPTLMWEEPAQTMVHAFDIKVPENLRVGYISAESEPVPDALKMLGINVEMLDANALNFGNLSKYDAIVVGVRAYELRSELPGANQRLLDYVSNGGTLVVQYERDFAWDGKNYAPYPAKIGTKPGEPLPRITDENSPVKFLKPDDSLLNTPNKITQDDFKDWVQERGLYFWSEYDSHYTPLLAMNDPGEKDLDGALLYTKLGKGTYIYTGIAFFRQLPEGVPGAYRLFVNLLAASRSH
jgi:LmbE family N-acetylglucosaminyl deacetylase